MTQAGVGVYIWRALERLDKFVGMGIFFLEFYMSKFIPHDPIQLLDLFIDFGFIYFLILCLHLLFFKVSDDGKANVSRRK